jgi:hypothetical protein
MGTGFVSSHRFTAPDRKEQPATNSPVLAGRVACQGKTVHLGMDPIPQLEMHK